MGKLRKVVDLADKAAEKLCDLWYLPPKLIGRIQGGLNGLLEDTAPLAKGAITGSGVCALVNFLVLQLAKDPATTALASVILGVLVGLGAGLSDEKLYKDICSKLDFQNSEKKLLCRPQENML